MSIKVNVLSGRMKISTSEVIKFLNEMKRTELGNMIDVVPNYYRLRLWWRRVWKPAYNRELLALTTARLKGMTVDGPVAKLLSLRMRLGNTEHLNVNGVMVRDVIFVERTTNPVPGDIPRSANRLALTVDWQMYAYRVEP